MPLTHGPQVGFPAGFNTIEQPPDHILAEEGNEVRGDAAFQVQRGAVLQTAALAGLTHRPAFHQHEDGGAVAWWVSPEHEDVAALAIQLPEGLRRAANEAML